jgi:hypothetical protein
VRRESGEPRGIAEEQAQNCALNTSSQ